MINRKIAVGVSCGIIALGFVVLLFMEKDKIEDTISHNVSKEKSVAVKTTEKSTQVIKTYNLYSETPYEIPFSSIAAINQASPEAQKTASNLLEKSQGFYYVNFNKADNTLEILLQNPVSESNTYTRHGLQYAYIKPDGSVKYSNKGYAGENNEIVNAVESEKDIWEFEESMGYSRPIKHVSYNDQNKVKYTETWNYDGKEPIKYEMKDADDRIVSVLKETMDDDFNYRKEHVFYDADGKTKFSLSAYYHGPNLLRFTYYDADKHRGITIISEFSDSEKVKEVLYNQDYALQNTYRSDYENGKRTCITIFDSDSKEIEKLSN